MNAMSAELSVFFFNFYFAVIIFTNTTTTAIIIVIDVVFWYDKKKTECRNTARNCMQAIFTVISLRWAINWISYGRRKIQVKYK